MNHLELYRERLSFRLHNPLMLAIQDRARFSKQSVSQFIRSELTRSIMRLEFKEERAFPSMPTIHDTSTSKLLALMREAKISSYDVEVIPSLPDKEYKKSRIESFKSLAIQNINRAQVLIRLTLRD